MRAHVTTLAGGCGGGALTPGRPLNCERSLTTAASFRLSASNRMWTADCRVPSRGSQASRIVCGEGFTSRARLLPRVRAQQTSNMSFRCDSDRRWNRLIEGARVCRFDGRTKLHRRDQQQCRCLMYGLSECYPNVIRRLRSSNAPGARAWSFSRPRTHDAGGALSLERSRPRADPVPSTYLR